MIAFSEIRNQTLYAGDGRSATIRDLWFDMGTGRISHALLDLGHWLAEDLALVTPDRISVAGEEWTLAMSDAELTRAPRWSSPEDALAADWPPIIIGPFGNALSLPLLLAQTRAAPAKTDEVARVISQITEAATGLLDAAVFAQDGELGAISDLHVDVSVRKVTHIVVTHPGGDTVIAVEDVRRHVDEDRGGHVLLKGTLGAHRTAI